MLEAGRRYSDAPAAGVSLGPVDTAVLARLVSDGFARYDATTVSMAGEPVAPGGFVRGGAPLGPARPALTAAGALINPATGLPISGAPLVIAAGTSLIPIGKLAQAATVDQTDHRVMTSPVDFRAAAVILGHVGPAAATYDATAIAVSTAIGNGRDPDGQWQQQTFSGAASVTIPAAVVTDQQPTYAVADLTPIESLHRTDGGVWPLIFGRAHNTTSRSVAFHSSLLETGGMDGHYVNARRGNGNFVSSNQAGLTADTSVSGSSICGFLLQPSVPVIQIANFGDSNADGNADPVLPYWSYLQRACISLQLQTGTPHVWTKLGWGSQTSINYTARLLTWLSAVDQRGWFLHYPDVIVYQTVTTNDWPSAAQLLAWQQQTLAVVQACRARHVALVIITPLPKGTTDGSAAYTAAVDAYRQAAAAWIRSLTALGVLVLDADREFSTSELPARWADPTMTVEGIHLTRAGHARLGAMLADLLV